MFLMKSPPLVTLQRKWEPFSTSRSCRYPICFSESEDDIARTTVSAKVQKIISNLQSDESSLGAGDEYGHIAQKKRKVATGRGHKLRGSGQVAQEHMVYGQCHSPADSDGMEVEENTEFGPFLLHTDSDDSVDQDIEEAIQEYLRNKGQGVQHLPDDAESFHGGQRFQQHEACDLFPPNVKAEVVKQHLDPDYLDDDTIEWATSPCSTSSDDSFEQSIKAEIEKFLNEKKQQEREMNLMREGKRLDPKEAPMSLALKSQKEGGLHRSSLKRGGKALFPRQLSEPQSSSAPLKCLHPEQPANLKKASHLHSRTAIAGHSSNPEQGREGMSRETQKVQNAVISDSSSDDGIEEAIRLYQLEKFKKEASSQLSVFQKDTFQAGRVANISTSLTIHSEKSALPGAPRKRRGKQLASKPVEQSRFGVASGEPEKGRCGVLAANHCASYAVMFQAACRTDTVTELMCAEAILDISKTVLPPTTVSDDKSLAMKPLHTQSSPPSQQVSDNNIVDSDDSIEQEIQAFLAAKAQAECLTATSKENWCTIQSPPSSDQPREQSRSPKQPILRTQRLSLRCRKKKQMSDKLSEVQCSLDDHSKLFASQSQDTAVVLKMGETRDFDACQWDSLATVSSANFANPLSYELGWTERRAKMVARASQKSGTGDKSSSLDSDEDLDTAIKDLLRSKRKLRKKPKDHRVQCNKKVTFGDTEMHVLQPHGGCKSGAAPLLKSCLTRSQIDTREKRTKPQPRTVVKGKPKSATVIPLAFKCKKEAQPKSVLGSDVGKNSQRQWPATSLTDDSSSVDSDDSIEQEIRKFLAEKATEANRTVEPLSGMKPQTTLLKAKCRPQQAEDKALSKWRKKVPGMGPPIAERRNPAGDSICEGERTVAHVGNQTPGKLQTVQTMGANSPAKRPAVSHPAISDKKLGRKSLHNYVKPFKRKKKCKFKISSKFIAGLKNARNKKAAVQVGKRPILEAVKREGGNSATSRLGEKCAMALQNRVPGCRNETGTNETDPERFQPCSPESPKEIQPHNKALSLAMENPAGRPELPNAEASQGHPLQVPGTASIREAKASTGCSEATIEEEEGRSQRPSLSWEQCSIPSSLSCLPLKENTFTSPDRLAEKQGQDVLEGGSPEFIKLNPCLLKSKPSSFSISTSIDPGWRMLPCIALSPTQLLASKTLAMQARRRALQVLGEKLGELVEQ